MASPCQVVLMPGHTFNDQWWQGKLQHPSTEWPLCLVKAESVNTQLGQGEAANLGQGG